jgi:NAD(P)-dependent dehydrogenase (short-subunit alcohol dehydrogenase family)
MTAGVLDRFSLQGKVAVVTGASSGLGAGFAGALAAAGADLVLAARRTDRLEVVAAAVRASGRVALAVEADITDPDTCTRVAETAVERFGHLDVLVNNAGIGSAVPSLRETPGAVPLGHRDQSDGCLLDGPGVCAADGPRLEPR